MTYFIIKHKATGKIMPQLVGRGYTNWNPSHPDEKQVWDDALIPRLFHNKAAATTSASHWYRGAYVMHRSAGSWPEIEPGEDLEIVPQPHRQKGDLEIIEVELRMIGQLELL